MSLYIQRLFPIIYKRKLGGLNKKADKLFKNLEEIQEKFATEISLVVGKI